MEKRRYYISVQAKSILEEQGEAAYELEMDATPEEAEKLKVLFDELDDFDNATFFRTPIPGIPYHHDSENDGYDYSLKEVYNFIYHLGTEDTKAHILTMNILS